MFMFQFASRARAPYTPRPVGFTLANVACIVVSSMVFLFSEPSYAQTLTGHEEFGISLAAAQQMTYSFQASAPPTDATTVLAEYFGRDAIFSILNQPECAGLRIYFARKSNGALAQVLVGVDAAGHDMTGGPLKEDGYPCPPFCDTTTTALIKH